MGLLKRIGVIALQVGAQVAGLGPLVDKLFPTGGKDAALVSELAQLAQLVQYAEVMLQETAGPDRAKKLAPLVAQAILHSPAFANAKIKDKALFLQGCTNLGGAMADILNSFEDKVETVDRSA